MALSTEKIQHQMPEFVVSNTDGDFSCVLVCALFVTGPSQDQLQNMSTQEQTQMWEKNKLCFTWLRATAVRMVSGWGHPGEGTILDKKIRTF